MADLESCPAAGLVGELDAESRLERIDATRQLAGDVHDAIEQFAVGDVGEVDVDVDPKVGLGREDLGPPLVAAGRTSKSISSRGSELPIGPHHAARWSGSVKAR